MTGMKDLPLLVARAPEPCPSQPPSTHKLLLLLRAGSAQTIVTSPVKTAFAWASTSQHDGETTTRGAVSARPGTSRSFVAQLNSDHPVDRVGRTETLNDVSGRKPTVFRKSPSPPTLARNLSYDSDSDTSE
ncbi:hypothetical protein T484DRAFT_1921769 [Baffinella frigidus]|nr:hypothetical protein T484DRAFT_1921769 [Cryptophyta sp. CCMP2293]